MKKVIISVLVICLCFGFAACGGAKDDDIKEVRNVSFEGTELTVTLGTNKSTGYEWDYVINGDCIEPSINRVFKVTGSQGDATGEVSIGFEGLSEGDAVIIFTTPNGWDGSGAGDAYTVNVSVNADGTIKSASGENGAADVAALSEKVLTQGETYVIENLFDLKVGEAYTYDDDLFLDVASDGMQWIGE